jgi:AraC-like DNA-binding protein
MDIENAILTDVIEVQTVYSARGRKMEIKQRHSYGLSFCIDGGQITYTQNGVDYVENKDCAIILPMGQNYALHGDATGLFPVINFLTLQPIGDKISTFKISNGDFLYKCYEEIKRRFNAKGGRAKILSLLYEMLHQLTEERGSDLIDPALGVIHDKFHQSDLTNRRLADECNISEVYFRKLFKAKVGVSPKQYVLTLRLQMAKMLLSEGVQKISAISHSCGFDSDAHFCRTFKEQVGMTPGEYRKKNQLFKI